MTQHDQLVEAVGRAIHLADKPSIDKLNAPFRIYGEMAQAALAAMRAEHVVVPTRLHNALLSFWLKVEDHVFDDPDLQEWAEEAGLLRAEAYSKEKHAYIITEVPFDDGDVIYLYEFPKLSMDDHGAQRVAEGGV